MTVSAILDELRDQLRALGLGIEDGEILSTPGRFGAAEVQQESFRAPAIRVAFLGAKRSTAQATGARRYLGRFAVFVLTEDGRSDERSNRGLDLMEAIARHVEGARIGQGFGHGLPEDVQLEPVYTGELERQNVSIHAVAWVQGLRLGDPIGLGAPSRDEQNPAAFGAAADIDITRMPGGAQ
ncbi:MAG: phage protein Gp37 [Paracoccaceae bacterium]